jgi:hypothetical protein
LFAGDWRELDSDRQWVRVLADRQAEAETGLQQAGLMDLFEYDGRGRLAAGAGVPAVAQWLVRHDFQVQALHPIERTLEDFYLETVHHEGR